MTAFQNIRTKALFLPLAAMCALPLSGCGTTASAATPAPRAAVSQNRTIEADGNVRTSGSVSLTPEFTARVTRVVAQEGQRVHKGDVLLELDTRKASQTLEALQNTENNLKNELAALQKELGRKTALLSSGSDPDLVKLSGDIAAAAAAAEDAAGSLQRLESSLPKNAPELETARAHVTTVKNEQAGLERQMAVLRDGKQQSIEALRQQIASREGLLKNASLETSAQKALLEAPGIQGGKWVCTLDDAVVSGLSVAAGDMLVPGQKIGSLKNMGGMVVVADIPEDFIRDVKPGQTASITPRADRTHALTGRVTRISELAIVKNNEGYVQAEIQTDDTTDTLRPDYAVTVRLNP